MHYIESHTGGHQIAPVLLEQERLALPNQTKEKNSGQEGP